MKKGLLLIIAFAVICIIGGTAYAGEHQVPIFTPYAGNPLLTSRTVLASSIFKVDDQFHMFFVELNSSGTYPADFNSDLLISADGLTFNPNSIHRNVISSQQSGHTFNYYVAVIKEGDTYKAWHSATSDWYIAGTKLYYSTSSDGMNYTGQGLVVDNESYPEYDSRNINSPCVVFDGNLYHLYYSAYPGQQSGDCDRSFHKTIACAISIDGINWTKYGVVVDGSEGSFDSNGVSHPVVIFDGTRFEMFYMSYDGSIYSAAYAISYDGLSWQKIGKVDSIDGRVVGAVKENGIYRIWYMRSPEQHLYELCYATALFTEVVSVDIKPGSDPNCFNNDGHGVIPVAILSDCVDGCVPGGGFDATQVDPATVELESLAVRVVGKSDKLQAHIEDVNNDDCDDLVVQIEDQDGVFENGETEATITGNLYDGTAIEGTDTICIVP